MVERKDQELEAFFAAAQDDTPLPSGDFMARIEADALAAMPVAPAGAALAPRLPLWSQIVGVLGGWQGMTGLAAACAAGVWIGVSPPSAVDTLWSLATGAELGTIGLDPVSGYDLTLLEG